MANVSLIDTAITDGHFSVTRDEIKKAVADLDQLATVPINSKADLTTVHGANLLMQCEQSIRDAINNELPE